MLIGNALVSGLVFSIFMAITICLILKYNPRLEMKSYPREIVNTIPKQTKEEKKSFLLVGIPSMIIALIYIGYTTLNAYEFESISFFTLTSHIFIILMVWNIVDLIVMDWIIFCTITPKFIVIPGTEGNPAYKDYKYHFIGFLKGIVISAIVAIVLGLILYMFFYKRL